MKHVFTEQAPEKQIPAHADLFDPVDESWGWSQLTDAEFNEFLELSAYAAHIGQFIHKNGLLSLLREQITKIASLEWITIKDGEKTPVKVTKHHTAVELNTKHEELAKLHREYEQRVNYFKAKVKNLVTTENARIAKANAEIINTFNKLESQLNSEYQIAYSEWLSRRLLSHQNAEAERELQIQNTAALRIKVDPRFKATVDMFLEKEA
jgi:hypothetical protein